MPRAGQTPHGARPNREEVRGFGRGHVPARCVKPSGRSLEPRSDARPRGMAVPPEQSRGQNSAYRSGCHLVFQYQLLTSPPLGMQNGVESCRECSADQRPTGSRSTQFQERLAVQHPPGVRLVCCCPGGSLDEVRVSPRPRCRCFAVRSLLPERHSPQTPLRGSIICEYRCPPARNDFS